MHVLRQIYRRQIKERRRALEADVVGDIEAGEITAAPEIDAAFAATASQGRARAVMPAQAAVISGGEARVATTKAIITPRTTLE